MKKIIIYIGIILSVIACSEDMQTERSLSSEQMELIGRAVNFNASLADPFTMRATYRRDGSFNEADIMYIYRQYSHDAGVSFDQATEAYRVYSLTTKYATGTSIALETDWKPVVGAMGHNPEGNITQTAADSLTWENGKTVRFRAWSRSNLANAIERNHRDYYYPDFCISEWVTVSGPTLDVPLTLKHQGCRIEFTTKGGNELQKAEICTEVEDYRWKDNNTNREEDDSETEHGKSLEDATAEANSVKAVYNQMCMPAGADVERALLTTMTKTLYNDGSTQFKNISTYSDAQIKLGAKTPQQITDEIQRPVFSRNDGRLDMITIPYDMSNDEKKGEMLTLPACTRIKIWLYDVNNGDRANTSGTEGIYHIFTLGDIKDKNGNKLFPKGMELKPGYSYRFDVGYHYDQITLTPADNFSWVEQVTENGNGDNEAVTPTVQEHPYQWWQDAIKKAIPKDIAESYNPQFHISTKEQFLEFIKLVNGTAVTENVKENPLVYVPGHHRTYNRNYPATQEDYRWYKATDVTGTTVNDGVDSVTHETAISEGYIFYQHYHPRNADQEAYTVEDYLKTPYCFFDDDLNRRFTVWLDEDLDLYDWELAPIGDEDPSVRLSDENSHPFRGIFDGYDETDGAIHSLKNVNFRGGYMFRHCFDAAIRNLKIETTHNFMLLNTAEAKESNGYGAYIVGISIYAPSSGNPFAKELKGSSYVVGCFYEGRAGGAMVGTANNLNMYGNMMAATGLAHNTGALLGQYAAGSSNFFAPQTGKKVAWGRFMGNYYLMDRYDSNAANVVHAVGTITDKYRPQEYIRGALAWVLKQKNDNLLSADVPYEKLTTELMRKGYYGLAPWKAMNYAIYQYNLVGATVKEAHNCKGHFVNDNVGYAHTYPHMVVGEPNSSLDQTGYKDHYGQLNFLELNN